MNEVFIRNTHLSSGGDILLATTAGHKLTMENSSSDTPGSSITPAGNDIRVKIRDEAMFIHHKEGGFSLIAGNGAVWIEGDAHGLTMA